jgi:hypothetical protein
MRLAPSLAVVFLVATVAWADDLTGHYRVDGVASDATRTSGEVTLVLADDSRYTATRLVDTFPDGQHHALRGTGTLADDVLDLDLGGDRGITGALTGGTRDQARARYRSDGRGGLVGSYQGPEGVFEETLSPLLADDAALVSATAALSGRTGAAAAHAILELARAAEATSLTASRAFVDGLVARDGLYRTLALASSEDRLAIAAIASRVAPPDPGPRENAAFERLLESLSPVEPRGLIVVPGETGKKAAPLHEISDTAKKRCARAAADWKRGRAAFILTSGGAVHPESTPVVEALELKAELVRLGVPAERIAVDARARHSTTNLRNAGRFMIAHGFGEATVITGVGQSFYFAAGWISTFDLRCRKELGYEVGELRPVDPWRTAFRPSRACLTVDAADPFDP